MLSGGRAGTTADRQRERATRRSEGQWETGTLAGRSPTRLTTAGSTRERPAAASPGDARERVRSSGSAVVQGVRACAVCACALRGASPSVGSLGRAERLFASKALQITELWLRPGTRDRTPGEHTRSTRAAHDTRARARYVHVGRKEAAARASRAPLRAPPASAGDRSAPPHPPLPAVATATGADGTARVP